MPCGDFLEKTPLQQSVDDLTYAVRELTRQMERMRGFMQWKSVADQIANGVNALASECDGDYDEDCFV